VSRHTRAAEKHSFCAGAADMLRRTATTTDACVGD
jgi:hypothetical protein